MTHQDYIALLDSYGGHFSPSEFSGDIKKMDSCFLRNFLAWRQWHGFSTMISSAYRKGNTGVHGKGMAIDCLLFTRFRQEQVTPIQHWLTASAWGFKGIGLYFDWNYWNPALKSSVPAIGLHVDSYNGDARRTRPLRWLRIDGLFYYQSLQTGFFFCRTNGRTISLAEAIESDVRKAS